MPKKTDGTTASFSVLPVGTDIESGKGPGLQKDEENESWQWRDAIGFLVLGLVSDALPGFFFSGTILAFLTPDANQGLLQFCADIGGVLGVLVLSVALYKLCPDSQALIFLSFQVVGMVLCWLLPYPLNMIGVGVLCFGFSSLLAVMLPLTTLKPRIITSTYQFGSGIAPVVGATIIQLGLALDFGKNALFATATVFPVTAGLVYYLVIDRTPWAGWTRKHVPVEQTNTENEKMTLQERWQAFCEAKYYMLLVAATLVIFDFHLATLQIPNVSLTGGTELLKTEVYLDQIQLLTHILVCFVGALALIPQMARIPRSVLWLPVALMAGICVFEVLQVLGLFYPIHPLPYELICVAFTCSKYFVFILTPLVMREDKTISRSNLESSVQLLFLVQMAVGLVTDAVCVGVLQSTMKNLCLQHAGSKFSLPCSFSS